MPIGYVRPILYGFMSISNLKDILDEINSPTSIFMNTLTIAITWWEIHRDEFNGIIDYLNSSDCRERFVKIDIIKKTLPCTDMSYLYDTENSWGKLLLIIIYNM
jgi:hypothetical protein